MILPRLLLPPALALACAACTQSPPPDPARRATIPAPDAATPGPQPATSGIATPARLRYDCDDGSAVNVEYVAETARVELPDGRVATLPKAQSASKGGGEVFVGEMVSLQRDGSDLQLHRGEDKALACHQSASSD